MIVVCICVLQCLDFEFQEYLRLTFIVNATMELIRHYRNNCQGDVFSRCGNEGHVCSLSTVWSGLYSGFRNRNPPYDPLLWLLGAWHCFCSNGICMRLRAAMAASGTLASLARLYLRRTMASRVGSLKLPPAYAQICKVVVMCVVVSYIDTRKKTAYAVKNHRDWNGGWGSRKIFAGSITNDLMIYIYIYIV